MKGKTIIIASLLLIVCSALWFSPTAQAAEELEDIDVLVIIATGFGWNYFDIVEQLEDWGVNVITASTGLDLTVASCFNKEPRPVDADVLAREMDNETLEQFDALVIPSGGHWNGLVSSKRNLDFISWAHDRGLVIATMCIGNRVVCRANNIVNHTKVASYAMTNSEMRDEGATIISSAVVVSDNRIITGGAGAGFNTGGHEGAPTREVCTELVRTVLGVSYVQSASIGPTTWNETATYEISVTIQDPSSIITELNSSEVDSVRAVFYPINDFEVSTKTVNLYDTDEDGTYTGSFTDLRRGSYKMSIEVETEDNIVEVVRTDQGILLEETTPAFDFGLIGITAGIGVIAIVVVIVIILKKRG